MAAPHRNKRSSRAIRFSTFQLRNDALIIGPGGELVEAHASGDAVPAIPDPIVGRIPADPGRTIQDIPSQAQQPVVVTFTGVLSTPENTALPQVSAQVVSLISATPLPTPTALSFATAASSVLMSSFAISASTSTASISSAVILSAISASSSRTTDVPASSSTSTDSSVETPAISAGTDRRGASLSVAIVFAVLAGFALVVALVVWFTKIRAKSHRQELIEKTVWPWDRDDRPVEGGCHTSSFYGQHEKSAPSLHSVLPLPPGLVGRDEIMHDSHHIPMPQSPYRLISNDIHQSVYDLAPEMGSLRVANYVPGDSRATSRLGMMASQPSGSTEGPNASLDDFGMLKHPWPSLRHNSGSSTIPEEKKDPYYFSNDGHAEQSSGIPNTKAPSAQDTWVSSLRSNIVNAFQIVTGNTSSAGTHGDSYTAEPVKVNPASRQGVQRISRQNSIQSQTALSRQTSRAGQVIGLHNQSAWLSGSSPAQHSDDRHTDLPVPPLAIVKNRDRDCSTLSRASSVYSTASASRAEPPATGFGLPHIPMSRSGSQSSLQRAFRGKDPNEVGADSDGQASSTRNRAHSVIPSVFESVSPRPEAWEQYTEEGGETSFRQQ